LGAAGLGAAGLGAAGLGATGFATGFGGARPSRNAECTAFPSVPVSCVMPSERLRYLIKGLPNRWVDTVPLWNSATMHECEGEEEESSKSGEHVYERMEDPEPVLGCSYKWKEMNVTKGTVCCVTESTRPVLMRSLAIRRYTWRNSPSVLRYCKWVRI
jgi:hypothetical protein